ncbi:ras guanine nucleotide exchange factor domain-containing protein [Flammula alnicola]|nr:ras guanine nucleotide exchange factor domain-containing protein [Flammula alnicola]
MYFCALYLHSFRREAIKESGACPVCLPAQRQDLYPPCLSLSARVQSFSHSFNGYCDNVGLIVTFRATYAGIENVKLYKQQCGDMGGRCVNLMLALRDSSRGLEGSKVQEIADEIESIIVRIHRKVKEWGSWNQLKSFLQQGEIKDGIDRLHRDIDAAMMKFNIQVNMEMTRGQLESKAIQERDKAEIRDLLQVIVKSNEDMKALLTMQPSRDSRPVEEMMESLQTELMNPSLEPIEEEVFKAGLWELHQKTSKLPPLTDLSGQVTLSSQSTIAKGSFNDIFRGQWLDREPHFQREVSIWRELDHPNVVPLYGVTYIGEDLYSVSPWMDNGTAVSYVKKFPAVDRLKLLTDAAFGLEYLHNRGIVHGDLRGANVLISQDGTARLSDFGLSKFLEDCRKGMTTSHSLNPRWFAPELLQQTGPLSTHSDVWSFGMICLEILSGEMPFRNFPRDIAVLRELDNGKLPDHPGQIATLQGLSDDMWALMRRCWQKKPESRPPISDVKTSILAIRGIISGTGIFFSRTPSDIRPTSSSSSSKFWGRLLRPPSMPSNETQEIDQLSPLALSPSPGFLTGSIERRNGRHKSVSSTGPSFHTDLDRRSTFSPPFSPRALSFSYSSPPTLEVPHLSSSLPTPDGRHFPTDRSASHDGNTPSPIRSIISSDSGIQLTGPVREAITDTRVIVNVTESGVVSSGTLEGLVQRLITNFNSRKDIEYRDVLLTACADFTTPEDLFGMLSRHFYEAESNAEAHPEDRVALQYNVFMVIMYWLSNRHLPVDHQLLWQMKTFCESAIRMKSSVTMSDKARDLLKLIEDRARNDTLPPPLSPGRRTLQASEIKPNDLAIALTLHEGDKYKVLVPSDYIAHLRRHPGYNAVEGAYTTNNKIVFWVKDSILHYDGVEQRTEVLKFFIHTAQECRKLRNFSSLVAIASALHSAPIERLKLTRSALTVQMQGRLQALDDIINPSSNHRGYREALNDATSSQERDCCIPWLAVHLKELHLVLQKHPTIVQVNGRPLINFQRYIKFMDRVQEVVHYKPPNLEQYRQQGQLDYLINQLQKLKMTPTSDDELMARSKFLEARETLDYKTRRSQLKTLGFKTS